jgi:hypothetical protein
MPLEKGARVAGWRCFQGDSLGDVFPGLKPMGCSVFALRAIQNAASRMRSDTDLFGFGYRTLTRVHATLECVVCHRIVRVLMHATESDEYREEQECKGHFGNSGMNLPC